VASYVWEVFVTSLSASPLDVGQAYLGLHHQLHRLVDQRMSAAGLSLARFKVLLQLNDRGAMNQATLAGRLSLAPRSVTDIVDGLERDGLVDRALDANDRRARIVTLTPAGRAAFAAAQVVRLEAMNEIFGRLSATDRTTLVALLATISANLPSGDVTCGQ
jgi:DNA-binding MarR family transcriptional regulator